MAQEKIIMFQRFLPNFICLKWRFFFVVVEFVGIEGFRRYRFKVFGFRRVSGPRCAETHQVINFWMLMPDPDEVA